MGTIVEAPASGQRESKRQNPNMRMSPAGTNAISQAPFAVAIFLSAFLLFQVQLILGKLILPLFGGAPTVWTACLLVFQILLLAGYAYAHLLASRGSLLVQGRVQILLLAIALASFIGLSRVWPTPITPGAGWRPSADADPVSTIVLFLLAAIGLPFFLLSTTGPLLQHWFAKASPGRSPYRLYALSNAGSLLGLLSYPFLVEPNLRIRTQAWVWVAGYAVFAVGYAACALRVRRISAPMSEAAPGRIVAAPLGWSRPVLWISLAACASTLLMATTNFICQEVAVIPFLWVLPLSTYLLSFILCFESERWYRPKVFHPLFAVTSGLVVLHVLLNTNSPYLWQLAACSVLLFAGCMVCHGEAARTRPGAEHLTKFFLCIALGGALGGIFVTLLAPKLFPNYWEFPLGLLFCTGLLFLLANRDANSWWHTGRLWLAAAIAAGIAYMIPGLLVPWLGRYDVVPEWVRWGITGCLAAAAVLSFRLQGRGGSPAKASRLVPAAAICGFLVLLAGAVIAQQFQFYHALARSRNFYGVLTVVDIHPGDYIVLEHGKTVHGFQFHDPQLARLPAGYYGTHSGVGILLQSWQQHPMRVGVVGMGTGALSALGRAGDVYRFYEINPDVLKYSWGEHPFFTYIKDSAARTDVVLGDARLSMENEAARGESQNFDVLVLDAFSSDAIPMHLLTREAFGTYVRHLRGPDSVIVVHITNKTLRLAPVLAGIAQEFHWNAVRTHPTWMPGLSSQSDWILLSRSFPLQAIPPLKQVSVPFPGQARPILWTDDYSDLFHVMR